MGAIEPSTHTADPPDAGRPAADAAMPGEPSGALVRVEIEQALGPGIDFERDGAAGWLGRRVRPGGAWLGFDRAALVDSDDGRGRRLPVLVGVPASTFAGARLEVELTGGWASDGDPADEVVLVGRVPGGPSPNPGVARIAAGVADDATWLDPAAARRAARRARQRHRERRSHARIVGGRAWLAQGALPPEVARFATPHSAAEYRLSRLPPRYLRGLEGLLDDGERVLYWVERPALTEIGVLQRVRGGLDRRAALLVLTDRQLLWIVDHAQPDRFLSDWGVDLELVPIERVTGVTCARDAGSVALTVTTPAGSRTYVLPPEHEREVGVMRDLVARFTPGGAGNSLRRRYPIDAIAFDPEPAGRFGQAADARALVDTARERGEILAALYSPRRPGQRRPAAIALASDSVELLTGARRQRADLASVPAIALTLSPLAGRMSFGPQLTLSYPAPLADQGVALVRLARKAMANLA